MLLIFSFGGLAIGAFLLAAYSLWGQSKTLKLYEARVTRCDKEIKTLTVGALGMGQRILALEGKLNLLENDSSAATESVDYAYSQAKQMFAQGADSDTVASNCGFSSSEAELMALIHRRMEQEEV